MWVNKVKYLRNVNICTNFSLILPLVCVCI